MAFKYSERARSQEILVQLANAADQVLSSVDPIDIETLQDQVLEENLTLVSYYVNNDGVISTWVIDQEHFEVTPTTSFQDFEHDVTRIKDLFDGQDSDDDVAKELYRKLITPLKPYIRHRNLVIVAHKQLHHVPFAALQDPETGRYLVEDYTLSYTPSASALKYLRRKHSPLDGEVLILGNPTADLEQAELEARMVADLFKTRPLIGQEATETVVRERAGSIDLLHLAAHGLLDPKTPRRSHILLAEDETHDGRLETRELFDEINLNGVNLVVLSACETARGQHRGGDEIISLTRAFLHAGSPSVISTLWAVEDEASAVLMQRFYCRLLEGNTMAESLAFAQRDVLRMEAFSKPSYWAAFKLTGDYGQTWTDAGASSPACPPP